MPRSTFWRPGLLPPERQRGPLGRASLQNLMRGPDGTLVFNSLYNSDSTGIGKASPQLLVCECLPSGWHGPL